MAQSSDYSRLLNSIQPSGQIRYYCIKTGLISERLCSYVSYTRPLKLLSFKSHRTVRKNPVT